MIPEQENAFNRVKELTKLLDLQSENYEEIQNLIITAMKLGLTKEGHKTSSIKMYPSYVTKIPDGTENGTFLALDLGGTNYRVIMAEMSSDKKSLNIEERTHAIPKEKMRGSGQELFEFIAQTLQEFLKFHSKLNEDLKLGFTFSFPCEQKGLDQAYLVRWTKGFDAKDVVGKNICQMLQDAINKLNLKVHCIAVVNDTVGTLAACALEDPNCALGVIIGTGTNAAYPEKIENVETLSESSGEVYPNDASIIINTEWGAFGENGEIDKFLTKWDRELDKCSLHPGKQIFEKLCSGSYLGEIVRIILLDLIQQNLLFRGQVPESLKNQNGFLTKYITETERDPPHLFYSTQYMLSEDLKVPVAEPIDFKIVRHVCELVTTRASFLIGTGISAVLHNLGRNKVTVGIDGSLYKFHPKFRERMTSIIHSQKPKDMSFHLRLSEDGSGKGAAAIVAAATRPNS